MIRAAVEDGKKSRKSTKTPVARDAGYGMNEFAKISWPLPPLKKVKDVTQESRIENAEILRATMLLLNDSDEEISEHVNVEVETLVLGRHGRLAGGKDDAPSLPVASLNEVVGPLHPGRVGPRGDGRRRGRHLAVGLGPAAARRRWRPKGLVVAKPKIEPFVNDHRWLHW